MKSGSCGPGAVHLVSQLTLSRGRDVQDFRFSLGPIPASGIPAIDAFLSREESGGSRKFEEATCRILIWKT